MILDHLGPIEARQLLATWGDVDKAGVFARAVAGAADARLVSPGDEDDVDDGSPSATTTSCRRRRRPSCRPKLSTGASRRPAPPPLPTRTEHTSARKRLHVVAAAGRAGGTPFIHAKLSSGTCEKLREKPSAVRH